MCRVLQLKNPCVRAGVFAFVELTNLGAIFFGYPQSKNCPFERIKSLDIIVTVDVALNGQIIKRLKDLLLVHICTILVRI